MTENEINIKYFFGKSLVTTMSGGGLSLVGKPGYYRDIRLISLLDHEIGTHHVRSLNQRHMPKSISEQIKKKRIGW